MMGKYILDGHEPVECNNLEQWANWFETANRVVAQTVVNEEKRRGVSTVFLGLDHNFREGPPILFESLICGGPRDGLLRRYGTWEEAEAGHRRLCEEEAKIADDETPRLVGGVMDRWEEKKE